MHQWFVGVMIVAGSACAPPNPGADYEVGEVSVASAGDPAPSPSPPAPPVATPAPVSTNPNAADPNLVSPPAGPTCPPGKGNAAGVGTPCTAGGNQCAPFGFNGFVCGADIAGPATKNLPLLQQCLGICDATLSCGAGAECVPNPLDANGTWICLPDSCVAKPASAKPPSVNTCLPAKRNEKGLGNLCTKNGNECGNAGLLTLCSAAVLPSSPLTYCTTVCTVDSECGSGMKCMHNLPNSGAGLPAGTSVCVPSACLPALP